MSDGRVTACERGGGAGVLLLVDVHVVLEDHGVAVQDGGLLDLRLQPLLVRLIRHLHHHAGRERRHLHSTRGTQRRQAMRAAVPCFVGHCRQCVRVMATRFSTSVMMRV
jgi:hypothetical protein